MTKDFMFLELLGGEGGKGEKGKGIPPARKCEKIRCNIEIQWDGYKINTGDISETIRRKGKGERERGHSDRENKSLVTFRCKID